MQDKYAGDIGDFGKFVLLRHTAGLVVGAGRIGVNWYRTILPGEITNDGRHTHYITSATPLAWKIRDCDPDLCSKLRRIVESNDRSIGALQSGDVLPSETLYYPNPLPDGSVPIRDREERRMEWLSESLKNLEPSEVIFLDPDNGFASPSVKKTQSRAGKYAFVDEVAGYLGICDLVIVYQHRDRSPTSEYFDRLRRIHQELGDDISMRIVRFKRISVRDYVFLFRNGMAETVGRIVDRLTAAPYSVLFSDLPIHPPTD